MNAIHFYSAFIFDIIEKMQLPSAKKKEASDKF